MGFKAMTGFVNELDTCALPQDGYLTRFLTTGRKESEFRCDARDTNQLRMEKAMRALAARHEPLAPPAPDAIRLGGPSPLGQPWQFYYSHGNIFLDDSTFYIEPCRVELHAVTELWAERPCTLRAWLWSYDAADVWVNGRHAGGIALPCYKPCQRQELALDLQAGRNQVYLRLETVGVRDTRIAFALQLLDTPAAVRCALPDPDAVRPCLHAAALLDSAVLAGGELRTAGPLPAGAQLRYHEPDYDFRSTAPRFTLQNAGGRQAVELLPKPHFTLEIPAGPAVLRRTFARPELQPPVYRSHLSDEQMLQNIAAIGSMRREETDGFALYPMLARCALGRFPESDHAELAVTLDQIERRMDCADFMTCALVRYIREYDFPQDLKAELRRVMLNFRYWMDEPGQDCMCFWSENHTLMFYQTAYFFGGYYPDEVFVRSGLTGRALRQKARGRIAEWLEDVNEQGFDEFNSTVYTPITYAALLNLVDYAEPDLAAGARKACDLLWRQMARHVFRGVVVSPMGRVYGGVLCPWRESLQGMVYAADRTAPYVCNEWLSAAATTGYAMPADIPALMAETGNFRYNTSNAVVEVCKTPDYMLTSVQSPRRDGTARVWQPDEREEMQAHHIYVKSLNEHFHGTTQFQPGEYGYQQHMWSAALDTDLLVFANHPGQTCDVTTEVRPGYWFGNGVMPALRQQGRVLGAVYCIPDTYPIRFTHLYWDAARFDETAQAGGWLFGRKGDSYIGVWCSAPLADHSDVRFGCEKRALAPNTAYLVVCGSRREDGGFPEFTAACRARDVRFDESAATLHAAEFDLTFTPAQNGTQTVG